MLRAYVGLDFLLSCVIEVLFYCSFRKKIIKMAYQKFKSSAVLLILALIAFSCNEAVEAISVDVPVAPDGINELVINTSNTNASVALGEYTLTVSGPGQNTVITGNTGVDVVTGVVSGTYTITAEKDGFLGATRQVLVVLPSERTEDSRTSVSLSLTKEAEPVIIDAAVGGTIVAEDPTGSTAPELETTVVVPAGALASAGTTGITVTPVPAAAPSTVASAPAAPLGASITFGPAGLEFDVPIVVTVPLNIAPSLVSSVSPLRLSYTENGELTGEFVDLVVAADGKSGTGEISHFSTVVVDWSAVYDLSVSSRIVEEVVPIGCREDYSDTRTITSTKVLGDAYKAVAGENSIEVKQSLTFNAVDYKSGGLFTNKYTYRYEVADYTLTSKKAGVDSESVTGLLIQTKSQGAGTKATCHISGGG